ncbi:hypothetical protein D7Y13_00725 [Corallococcus praedator]|uniref:Glycosyltransferase RgtA/B/C/D-like domain-containing protein n=1 Tax=Corallococcus praedator TaxID=2316724 RepID=A0ABX9QRD5_9BACT|nr:MULTISPECIES: hypothetical protein [Corallococcus]RKH35887.1 hypothetical protein D7X75_02435 [Corallococcus sp. CA031C]RKI17649.1 hypothetical protein D7Y13_00725 [Corallococcus praedator]
MRPSPSTLLRVLYRIATTAGLRLAFFGLLALVAAWEPLSQVGRTNDFRDAHLLYAYEEAGARTVATYGQAPLWNPWTCGGQYALGSPQTRVASPTVLLSAALGAHRAEAVVLWLFLVLGMEGFYRFARQRTGSAAGALVAAPFFGLAGFTAHAWSLGWLNFAGFLLLPWLLFGTRRAAEGHLEGAALVAGGFALQLGFGSSYPVPMSALFVALEAVRTLVSQPVRRSGRWRAGVWALGATALFTLGASMFRLWPLVETMRSAPRIMAGTPSHSLETVGRELLQFPSNADVGHFFFLPGALVLALGAVLARRRAAYPAVLAGLCLWLASGYAAKPSLFAALRLLPVFGTLRYPERFLVPAGLFLAELAALGFAALLLRSTRGRAWKWASGVACALAVAGIAVQVIGFSTLAGRVTLVPTPIAVDQPFAQTRGNRWAQGYFLPLNRGSIACGEAWPVPMSERLRGDLPQEEYLEDPGAGTARRVTWTPNRLEVDVDATRPTALLINQNWHPGWKSSVGEVVSREGLLGVTLPAGHHRVELRFLPRSGLGGTAVSALAWGGLALLAWAKRRRGGASPWPGPRAVAVAALPLVAMGAMWVGWHEPEAMPVLRNTDGSLLGTAELPANARVIHGRFERPVELVAAQVPSAPDARGIVPVVLYWQVRGKVPRSVGIWVHVAGPGERKTADHAVVGGTFFFRDAPRRALLRDAFALSAKDWEPGEWKVLVGLWYAGDDGARLKAFTDDGTPVPEDRFEVGTITVPPKPKP